MIGSTGWVSYCSNNHDAFLGGGIVKMKGLFSKDLACGENRASVTVNSLPSSAM